MQQAARSPGWVFTMLHAFCLWGGCPQQLEAHEAGRRPYPGDKPFSSGSLAQVNEEAMQLGSI